MKQKERKKIAKDFTESDKWMLQIYVVKSMKTLTNWIFNLYSRQTIASTEYSWTKQNIRQPTIQWTQWKIKNIFNYYFAYLNINDQFKQPQILLFDVVPRKENNNGLGTVFIFFQVDLLFRTQQKADTISRSKSRSLGNFNWSKLFRMNDTNWKITQIFVEYHIDLYRSHWMVH